MSLLKRYSTRLPQQRAFSNVSNTLSDIKAAEDRQDDFFSESSTEAKKDIPKVGEAVSYQGQISDRLTEEDYENQNLMDVRIIPPIHVLPYSMTKSSRIV